MPRPADMQFAKPITYSLADGKLVRRDRTDTFLAAMHAKQDEAGLAANLAANIRNSATYRKAQVLADRRPESWRSRASPTRSWI